MIRAVATQIISSTFDLNIAGFGEVRSLKQITIKAGAFQYLTTSFAKDIKSSHKFQQVPEL
jgi:hypothetical protein